MYAAMKSALDDLANDMGDVNVGEPCYRIAQSPEVGRHIVVTKKLSPSRIWIRNWGFGIWDWGVEFH